MTGKELIAKLQELDEETLNKQVKFFNPKYEFYETVTVIRDVNNDAPLYNFILLNEG